MEKLFYQKIKSESTKLGYCLERIETSTVSGFPDILLIRNKEVFFVELKVTDHEYVFLEPSQISWHISFIKKTGLQPYVLVYNKKKKEYLLLKISESTQFTKLNDKCKVNVKDVLLTKSMDLSFILKEIR